MPLSGGLQLFIVGLDGETRAVEVPPEASVANVREAAGLGPLEALSFGEIPLHDRDALLSDLGICPEATLHVCANTYKAVPVEHSRVEVDDCTVSFPNGGWSTVVCQHPVVAGKASWKMKVLRSYRGPDPGNSMDVGVISAEKANLEGCSEGISGSVWVNAQGTVYSKGAERTEGNGHFRVGDVLTMTLDMHERTLEIRVNDVLTWTFSGLQDSTYVPGVACDGRDGHLTPNQVLFLPAD
eukprot:TRINITY_DN13531_c0_g1_i1.p1 TRINITY_DN13531_c0_g1~~TRINITY_DN13531_c0_g1_i1.p1  ORF type:complete len:240 (+),score=31.18 TRINITY_DN13531_c0_g1_i1:76-795(+)